MGIRKADLDISRKLKGIAEYLVKKLKKITGQDTGFMLVVFNYDDNSRTNYVSNCDRGEVKEALEELLKKWDEGMPDIPSHEIQ